jgi:hypothetical protein
VKRPDDWRQNTGSAAKSEISFVGEDNLHFF